MRILYSECETQYALDIINQLSDSPLDVVCAASHMKTWKDEILQQKPGFSKIKILDSKEFYNRASLNKSYADVFVPLDKPILDFFSEIESDFYTLTDRTNFVSVTFRERKRFFRDLIRFWIGFLQKNKIEGVYFPYAPHVCWELVLYQAARYLGLKCFYFSHTAINNRSLMRTNFHEIDVVPKDHLQGYSIEKLEEVVDAELLADFYADSIVTNAVISDNDKFNKQAINIKSMQMETINRPPRRSFKQKLRIILGKTYKRIFRSHIREFYLPLAMDQLSTPAAYRKEGRKHNGSAQELKCFYEKNAEDVDLSVPYVYFPMHLQPELTTHPEAGIYEDHFLVLETLLAALPDKYQIYVKENPRQYDTTINKISAQHFRDKTDLLEMLHSGERVKFVSQSVSSADLIHNTYACITQTGTVGWEALTMGYPCIAFAKPWYSGCASCLQVSDVDSLKHALEDVPKHTKEVVKKNVLKYLHYYNNKFFIGSLSDPTNVAFNTVSYDVLMTDHCRELIRKFSK